ncbi:hypothetical protein HV97_03830 [Pseudomonas aeruginosa]|nr:hypothetical protein HV97_03830 [Pseudomonas aeruginosa]
MNCGTVEHTMHTFKQFSVRRIPCLMIFAAMNRAAKRFRQQPRSKKCLTWETFLYGAHYHVDYSRPHSLGELEVQLVSSNR